MENKKTFEIYFIRKIPFLTNGLLAIFFISIVAFITLYKILGGKAASPEVNASYLLNSNTIKLLYTSAISTGLSALLYILARRKKKGLLIFNTDSLELLFKEENLLYPLESIRRVYCNDSETKNGEPSKRFTMTIETWKNKKILVRVRNTNDINKFINKLLSYENLKIDHINVVSLD